MPNVISGTYNVAVKLSYTVTQTECAGTHFDDVMDDDANPGWDIWYLNCVNCPIQLVTTTLKSCDTDKNGTEIFNLLQAESIIAVNQPGLTFAYFEQLNEATSNINPIAAPATFTSLSKTIYVRVSTAAPNCFKIIPITLQVRNPIATISGILNVCAGGTVLTASNGASYTWSTGAITAAISVNAPGTYHVTVTDADGCVAQTSATIIPNGVAVNPTLSVLKPGCLSAYGSITVTSPMTEVSFDGGTTWQTSPALNPANLGTYNVKIRTASGCESYSSTVYITPFNGPFPRASFINPTFCGGLGSITVTTTAPEYSFDDGVTWTTNNTMDQLPLGTYHIRTKDANGCMSNSNDVTLEGEFLAHPIATKIDPYCSNLGSITITSLAAEFSKDGGNTWQASPVFNNLNTGSYIIKIKDNIGCTSPNKYIYLDHFEDSTPEYEIINAGCGVAGSVTITSFGDSFSFDGGLHWSISPSVTGILSPTNYQLIAKHGTCETYSRYVQFNSTFRALPDGKDYTTLYCDSLNDLQEVVDLTAYKNQFITNAAAYSFTFFKNENAALQQINADQFQAPTAALIYTDQPTVWVRITDTFNCSKVVKLNFTFFDAPRIPMLDQYPICENFPVTVDAGSGFASYLWTNLSSAQTSTFNHFGNYWVKVSEWHNNNALQCFSIHDFTLFLSNPAIIAHVETQDWTVHENSITVNVRGVGNYIYSLDGINFQTNNTFSGLETGEYVVYVKDLNLCGISHVERVFLLYHPSYFTPNNDGFHDYWQVDFSNFKAGLKVHIFNRFGKLLQELPYNSIGWDGRYNGLDCPADDYWFVVYRENGQVYKGHFALKR